MAETVGILELFVCLLVFFGCGFMLQIKFFKALKRVHETEVLDLADERDDITVLLAAVAAERSSLRIDRERWILIVMEGTEAHECVADDPQRHISLDDGLD